MSGYGTKKPGGERGVQLTFPTIFADQYATLRIPLKFAPEAPPRYMIQWGGSDEPAMVHQQWANEAHKRVADGVYATRIARQRAFSSPHGYYNLPKPVLGQRHIGFQTGALQSGNIASTLNLNTVLGGMSGGVLRTKAGQEYAKKLLDMRKDQLNRLEGVVLPPRTMEEPMSAQEERDKLTETARFELQSTMDSLGSVFAQQTDFTQQTTEQVLRFVQLLGRFMIEATLPEANTIKDNLEAMVEDLDMYNPESAGDLVQLYGLQQKNKERGQYFFRIMNSLLGYVNGMIPALNMSVRDKKSKSQSLLRSLKLSDITRLSPSAETVAQRSLARSQLARMMRTNPLLAEGERARAQARVAVDGRSDADMLAEQQARALLPRGATTRETAEHAGVGARFSTDARGAFGTNASSTGWFGEEGLPAPEAQPAYEDAFTALLDAEYENKSAVIGAFKNAYERQQIPFDSDTVRGLKEMYPALTQKDIGNIFNVGVSAVRRLLRESGATTEE